MYFARIRPVWVSAIAIAILGAAVAAFTGSTAANPRLDRAIDVRVGLENVGYFSVEIAPSMKYLSWQEVEGGQLSWQDILNGAPRSTWISGVDPLTADLIPAGGKGIEIPNIRLSGAPQWGIDRRGEFLVAIDAQGQLLQIRPFGASKAETRVVPIPPDKSRRYAYPSRLPGRDEAFVVLMQNDDEGRPQIWLADLAQSGNLKQITAGPVDKNGRAPTFVVTVYRWFEGLPVFTYGFNDAGGKIQMKEVDASAANPVPRPVTAGTFDHVDDFPFVLDGEKHLLGGMDSRAIGALHRYNAATGRYDTTKQFEPKGTALADPQMVASLEPFFWKGQPFATFMVLDGGRGPSRFPGEIWLTGLRPKDQPWRISGPERLNRMDPEVYVGTSKVWVFYYARTPGKTQFELRRAETGL